MANYARPQTLEEALDLLAKGRWRVLAGGTDFYPGQGARPIRENILDINRLDDLRGIARTDDAYVVGARTTWSELIAHDLPPSFDALKAAAREVGSVQIQNAATVAGNLCNASPAADGVPPLLVLDASVEIAARAGRRRVPLDAFVRGNRETALAPDEMVVALVVPRAATAGSSGFVKLGARRYLVISIAMAAARVALAEDGTIGEIALALGACSPVARRMTTLEKALRGRRPDAALAFGPDQLVELSPIDDVRASAAYRREAAAEILRRAIRQACDDGAGKEKAA
ncbi:xanthine dehydrogenase family protein subunit M [Nitratireductor sp. CAU 1489]|uniref:Xanthine dehydrogenase family protein subunit M n=1 Tax=Nitratireductor arenosus TaxID=2682096 RepID=A0A844QEN7_9HYPH|nr:FAD binding domain-containing protein [Nitratireductor arenosus]MVA97745.1 xanthine dehydrogenase family protein subunit M [Nitratireductor arenosus]